MKTVKIFSPIFLFIASLVFTAGCSAEPTVATTLTRDSFLSPVSFNNEVYIHVPESFDDADNTSSLGRFGFKDSEPDWFSQTFMGDFVYGEVGDAAYDQIKVRGGLHRDYMKASSVELEPIAFGTDKTCVLMEENWLDLLAKSIDGSKSGRHVVPDDYVQAMEKKFGEVTYRIEDFSSYDQCFTLGQYKNSDLAIGGGTPQIIGCILVIGDAYYYGNLDNEITGELLDRTKEFVSSSQQI